MILLLRADVSPAMFERRVAHWLRYARARGLVLVVRRVR